MFATLQTAVYFAFAWPIRQLYLRGPALFGYGFWEGLDESDVCSRLTGVLSAHWKQHTLECEAVIERKLESIHVLCLFATYAWILYRATRRCIKSNVL